MNEINDTRIDDSRLDEAIESYPLVELPEFFVASTMAQIEPREWVGNKVRLRFVDYAVPLFTTGFFGGVLYLIRELIQHDNGYWYLNFKTELAIWIQSLSPMMNGMNMVPLIYGGIALGFLGLISYIVYSDQASRIY